ncbi:PREDICTED: complement factor B-like [Priapulus caudatus]|uniref:Complement factor B-like n=1 Tax=Priapulus caudatus TaxID=37621 RepID=A0ABM1F253_PRICU|nr:PREDICTED: complement factor B-like [Priapulus caudatus]
MVVLTLITRDPSFTRSSRVIRRSRVHHAGFIVHALITRDPSFTGRLHQIRQASDPIGRTATSLKNNFLTSFSRKAAVARGTTFARKAGGGPNPVAVDIVLLLDSSGSVGSPAFVQAKTVLKDVVEFLNKENGVSSAGIRVGGVVFSETGKTSTKFNYLQHHTQNTLANVQAQILAIPFDNGGATATRVGLQQSLDMIRTYGRTGSQKSVFVLTDGQSNQGGDPCSKAAEMKNLGYEIFVWAIGKSQSSSAQKELECIANDDNHIFKIDTFSNAAEVTKRIRALCI